MSQRRCFGSNGGEQVDLSHSEKIIVDAEGRFYEVEQAEASPYHSLCGKSLGLVTIVSELAIHLGLIFFFAWMAFSLQKVNRELKEALRKNEDVVVPHWFRHVYSIFILYFIFLAIKNSVPLVLRITG